jgi:hypothetical protein
MPMQHSESARTRGALHRLVIGSLFAAGALLATTGMDAVPTGNAAQLADAAAIAPPAIPAYERARALHRRTVWSDLRKGVILISPSG